MNLTQLTAEVMRIVQDSSYTSLITGILNRGRLEIAGGGNRQHGQALLAPLPNLYTSDTVTVESGDSSVAMPAEYQRGLKMVYSGTTKLKRYDSHIQMMRGYVGETGGIEAYCLVGTTLFVAPSPTGDTDLTVYFYQFPTDMTVSTDTPSELPSHLHDKLLVNYACKEIYGEIEDGIEGNTPNFIKHTGLYDQACTSLERHIGAEDKEAQNVEDDGEYID